MAAVAGSVEFVIDGTRYRVGDSFTIKYWDRVKEMQMDVDGPYGHKEVGAAPGFDVQLSNTRDVSLKTLKAIDGVTVSALGQDGKQYILHEAIVEGEPEKDPVNGTITGFSLRGTGMDEV